MFVKRLQLSIIFDIPKNELFRQLMKQWYYDEVPKNSVLMLDTFRLLSRLLNALCDIMIMPYIMIMIMPHIIIMCGLLLFNILREKKAERMPTLRNKNKMSMQLPLVSFFESFKEEEIQKIIQHWIRILNVKLGWIQNFDKLVVKYVKFICLFDNKYLFANNFFTFDEFHSSSKLLKAFKQHTDRVNSLDCFIFDNRQFICSGSSDRTVCVWNIETNKQVQLFNGHLDYVTCVKFSQYYCYNNRRGIICSSSLDNTIRFWDIKHTQELQAFNKHTAGVCGIEFSSFNGGRYLCSGSRDKTIRLWDVETSNSLHVFNGHKNDVLCVAISPLQSNINNNNNNKSNSIGVIGGNGYTACSGSSDKTIRIWDIETTKQLNVFKGHIGFVNSVKYGSSELEMIGGSNTILSGSNDRSVRLWDIRSSKQIQLFNGHTSAVNAVEYSQFVIKNSTAEANSNVICSASSDYTIRFWDIRSSKIELYSIKRSQEITSLKFLQLKKKSKSNDDFGYCINICYGSMRGIIGVWG
ncbi:WD-40 repeat-containing protein [Reticulomyxa filosa]|uniref:WD-40 repeat-containing protein n=1 Tax=Reticulomyxa filosa TaxID=46433 RepID=X6M7X3_RETFI|nr:WD-40 repeat-containing protein [Reticulomyxa filosa]|eukprot:ETO09130.1 WD-40 repeat-containing protein [Reticulomyxa filosa]